MTTKNERPPIFVISGKSPKSESGGYPAYSYVLAKMTQAAGYKNYLLGVSEKEEVQKDKYGEIHLLDMGPLKHVPVLKYLALAGLPYYSFIFYRAILKITKEKDIKSFAVWGMGPWAFVNWYFKLLPPKGRKVTLISSYFTSTRHEMEGALNSITIKDYGIFPKIRYFLVYEIVARIFHFFEKRALDSCDLIIIHYKSSEKIIKKHFNVNLKKVHMFPWYTETFKRKGSTSKVKNKYKHPLVVSVSRQDPRKGLNFLIRAIELVKDEHPEVNCQIVGPGSFFELNKKLAEKLNITKNVGFQGFVPDINPIMKEADIMVVVPLRQGSSSLTIFEAMSHGKAIVASKTDGIPEDLEDKKTALLVPTGNVYAIARAIEKLIEDPKLRKTLEKNVQKRFNQRFSFEKTTNEIKKILDKNLKA